MSMGNTADTYASGIQVPRLALIIGVEERSMNDSQPKELLRFRRYVVEELERTLETLEEDLIKLEIPNIESLIQRYVSGYLSLGRAAELAGMRYDEFIDLLISKGISPDMGPESEDEFKEEEKLIEKILRMRRRQK